MNERSMSAPQPVVPQITPMPGRWVAMAFLLAASFMTMLDVSIVNVALPIVQMDLQANDRELEWVVASYILAYALGLLPLGRLGDIAGRKGMFVSGVAAFTAASLLCGLATSPMLLIGARVLQGIGAAAVSPQVMAIAVTLFAPQERARAFSGFGLVGGMASIVGAILGGVLLAANLWDLGWRACFYINLPIGLAVIAGALRFVPAVPAHRGRGNDVVGIVLAAVSILCLVFPLVEGRGYGWPQWCFALIVAALPLLLAFVAWERKQERAGAALLFPIYLLRNRDYVVGSAAIAVLFSALQGFFLVIVLFLQQGLRYTPVLAGLAMTAFSVGIAVATFLSGRMQQLRPKAAGGALILGLSFVALSWAVDGVQPGAGFLRIIGPMLAGGLGSGLVISALFQGVTRTVPLQDMGAASGSLQVLQQIGAALGVAFASQLFFAFVTRPDPQMPAVQAYIAGLQGAVLYFALACALVAMLAWVMPFRLPQRPAR